ncbi:Homologous-pairing protein [Lachnellula hyalina]|uniref:Homologous-pairing protein n=1 Tax=Lachnellula hyalina TaxID=1316788 RepID=A0A8H8QYP9_9HELO|nr:Homologous-pairing protein [Lachnellula hyalina]TVY23764.1 Homologous-pairing protein [Lachnellula hyalina]
MAPRVPKPKATTPALDDTSSIASSLSPLKPKASKVEKSKADKQLKVTKAKAEKIEKIERAGKGERKDGGGEKMKREISRKEGKDGKKDGGGGGAGGAGKEKVKAVTGDQAEQLIMAYLREQNRPYSATEVSANLHGKVTKTVADKMLKEMEQSGAIMGKASNGEKKAGDKRGGQWVFWCKQDPADSATPEELTAMDTTISTLRETTLPPLKTKTKVLTSKLSNILSAPTTADLSIIVSNLRASNAEKRERVQGFKDGGVKMVTKEESGRVEKESKYWALKRRVRKECFLTLEAMFLEGMPRDEVWERAGIEDGDAE